MDRYCSITQISVWSVRRVFKIWKKRTRCEIILYSFLFTPSPCIYTPKTPISWGGLMLGLVDMAGWQKMWNSTVISFFRAVPKIWPMLFLSFCLRDQVIPHNFHFANYDNCQRSRWTRFLNYSTRGSSSTNINNELEMAVLGVHATHHYWGQAHFQSSCFVRMMYFGSNLNLVSSSKVSFCFSTQRLFQKLQKPQRGAKLDHYSSKVRLGRRRESEPILFKLFSFSKNEGNEGRDTIFNKTLLRRSCWIWSQERDDVTTQIRKRR